MLDFLHVIEGRKNDEGFAHPSAQSGICVRPLRWQWERPARSHFAPCEQKCVHHRIDRGEPGNVETAVGQCGVHVIAEPLGMAPDRRRQQIDQEVQRTARGAQDDRFPVRPQ